MAIVRRSSADIDRSKIDWSNIPTPTDEEIDAQIASDPDAPSIFTPEQLARAHTVTPADRKRLRLEEA